MQIYGRTDDISQIPNRGDRYEDYKVTTKSTIFKDGFYEFTCGMSQDYVIKEMFTGLNSKRRYLQFASASDAFFSNHLESRLSY